MHSFVRPFDAQCRASRRSLGFGPVPWPFPRNFNFKGQTQECPDQDDSGEDGQSVQGGFNGHGVNDVGGHEKFQAEENGPAQRGSQFPVRFSSRRCRKKFVAATIAPMTMTSTPQASIDRVVT